MLQGKSGEKRQYYAIGKQEKNSNIRLEGKNVISYYRKIGENGNIMLQKKQGKTAMLC